VSLPGLTRQSILFKEMDARIKFAHDELEHFPTGMNRLGFPRRRESDSSRCMLVEEVSMHGQSAFR